MSTTLSILRAPGAADHAQRETCRDLSVGHLRSDSNRFAEEQVRGLVRRVFIPGWPRPARQVVFSAATPEMDMTSVCVRTAQVLASGGAGKVCLVEADLRAHALEKSFGRTSNDGGDHLATAGAMRKSSPQISPNLWMVPASAFLDVPENADSAMWVHGRLGELRRQFDFAVIHAPSAVEWGATALLAHLADGLVLGLEAHRTRRLTACSVRDQLVAANVHVLGVVLGERRFPIPSLLYQML